jgi:hypothetical protein
MSLLWIMGAKSIGRSLWTERGSPRYVWGKEETAHPKAFAMERAMD